METSTQTSSPEEAMDAIHLYHETADVAVNAAPVQPSSVKVLSPFTENLIHDVREKVGFGKVNRMDQYKHLAAFEREQELAPHECMAVRDAINGVLQERQKKAKPAAPIAA